MSSKIKRGIVYLILMIVLVLALSSCSINKDSSSITGFAVKDDKEDKKGDAESVTGAATADASNETANETDDKSDGKDKKEDEEKKEKDEKEDKEKPKENVPPVWKSDIEEFTLKGKTPIDLSAYFYDANNDSLAYLFTTPEKIEVEIDASIVTLTPKGQNFTAKIEFTATDGEKATTKEITLIVPEKTITNSLEYKAGTDFDANDDGVEPTTGITDMTVENSAFTWDADETKLCTRWKVDSIEDAKSTTICYGSAKCCNFIDLEPSRDSWKGVFYSTYGQYGATLNNVVSSQIIYADYSLGIDEPFAEIYYSEWKELPAKYYFELIEFENVCIDTCILSGFNDTSYKLIFEIENAVLNLDFLTYSISEEISNVPVSLEVKDDTGEISGSYTLYRDNEPVQITEGFVEPDYYNIEVTPVQNVIDKLVIENANLTKPVTASIGIDNVSREIIIENVDAKKRYAINLEELEFEKAILTATASANSLWKCRQWDYDSEVCFGTWEKVKDLTPGQQYDVTLTANDPGFIEGDTNITIAPVNITNATINITGLALAKDIPNITIAINKNATIDLNEYFSNIDENTIFTYFGQEGISILFEGSTATIMPAENFTGTIYTYITAAKGSETAISNVFAVNIVNVTIDITPTIILEKKDFMLDEDVEIGFEYLTKQELIENTRWKEEYEVYEETTDKTEEELELLRGKISEEEKLLSEAEKAVKKQKKKWQKADDAIETFVYDNSGNLKDVDVEIEELREGKFGVKIPKPRSFKAGRYTLKLDLTKDGIAYSSQQDFTWGVLAINVNKSIYLPNEDSFIGIGVLDDAGRVVCNADVTLDIINPLNQKTTLTTANGDISISPECAYLGVTELPDYYTGYKVGGVGAYAMNLTAVTANGVRSISDNFTVQSSVAFDVARKGPTRVYPRALYTMKIPIIANQDYNGLVNEYVPSSFAITPQDGLSVAASGGTSILSWNVDMKQNDKIELSYEFDAPDTSPEFYLLGPLDIGNFKEARQWQIANDQAGEFNFTYPDAGAPGMNLVVHMVGTGFAPNDAVTTNSSGNITVGPIIVTDADGNYVTTNGRVLTTVFYIHPNATQQDVQVNVSGIRLPSVFKIISPVRDSGNFTGKTSGVFGIGDTKNGTRTARGTIVLDSLIIPAGVTVNISMSDTDSALPGIQGYFPVTIIVDGIVNISGTLNVSGSAGRDATGEGGGGGGHGGPGGGGGGAGGGDRATAGTMGSGGNGFTGGGGGGCESGTNCVRGGDGGNGTGTLGGIAANDGGAIGGNSTSPKVAGGGGSGVATTGGGGGGGTGFFFGSSGAGSGGAGGSGGGGGGAGGISHGGGGGFGISGADGATGTGGSGYGSIALIPIAGGSGGGGGGSNTAGGGGAGGGGGAVLIFSNQNITVMSTGQILADGGNGVNSANGDGGGGSGGGIVLQAANVSLEGTLSTNAGTAGGGSGGAGGLGRIRVDGLDNPVAQANFGFAGSNFTGVAIKNITDTSIGGTANASANIVVFVKNQTRGGASSVNTTFTGTADANGQFDIAVTWYTGKNFIAVMQNSTNDAYTVMSSAAVATYDFVVVPDNTLPRINASLNNSVPFQGEIVNMTANVSDNSGLSFCQFVDNQSLPNGAKNFFNKTVSGKNDRCSQNYTIALPIGSVINFTVIVNDTSTAVAGGNLNQSTQIITVQAPPDTILPRINASLDVTSPIKNQLVNLTANITDESGLSFCQFIDNQSLPNGAKQFINKTVAGTDDRCSQNYTIALPIGSVINFTVIVNDTSTAVAGGNKNQTSQIIIVTNQASITNCTNLTADNTVYSLANDVNNPATCFKVLANNVTIDCHGFEVNYSQSVVGYGVNISRYNYTTIRSCYVTQGSGSTFSYGVYVLNSSNSIFYNNSVQVRGSSGYGMYLVSSTHSSMIYNNNITIRGANAYSIYLFDNAYNNSIYSNIITNTGLNGILLNSYAYNNSIYSNIITLGSLVGGSGLYLLANVYNNSIYGNTVTTSASAAYALRLTSTVYSNQIYNNNLTTSNSDSYGVYLNNDIFNNTIYGNNITTNNAVGSYSIYMLRDINNNTFYRNAISSLAAGVVVNGSTLIGGEETRFNTFTNDTIVPCTAGCAGNYQDIILTANATDITFTNVSFNKSRIAFVAYDPSVPIEKNNLTIRWFLNVNVTNSTNNAAMIGAEVVINNSLGTNVFTGSTNSDGSIATVTVTEFTMNGSAPFNVDTDTCVGISNVNITCFTPMNITVNITGYDSNFTSVDVNRSKLVNVSLGITAILDTTAPIVNATLNKSLQLIEFNDIINLTANTTDETGLSFGQIIVNDTGFVRYFNFSLGGATTAQFSQNISVSCSNCIINFTARANDTSNNFRTNDTIVSVTPEKEITNCTNLDTANTNYSLTQDANSGGTCFYVLANNVGLDCHGFEINYSQSVVGYGVNISGYNYSTIRSCNIVQADLAADNSNAYGVYIFNNVINNNVFNNTITTIGSQGYDVYLFSGAYNNSVYGNNLVYISGSFGIGVYLNSNVYNNSVYGNNINTSGSSAYAVYLNSNVYNNSVYGNNITSIEIGVYLFSSTFNNEIYGNTITTTGNSNAYGVNLQSTAYSNNIHDNVITTNGNSGSGIRLFNTAIYANSIYNNNITTRGGTAYGIVLNANVFSNNIYGNNITTRGGTSSGISMATTIYNNSFYGNVITTTGSTGYGMDLSGYNNSVYGNVITTKGSSGYGMLLSGYNNSVYSNNITTYNTSSYGIYLNSNVFNNTIYDNNITTKNMTGSYGIYLLNRVNNNTFYRNSISSLAIGILVNGSGQTAAQTTRFNTFTNDTIVPCTSGCASNYQDIVLTANATDITFTNVSFNKSRVEFVPRSLSVPVEKNNMTVRWFLAVNVTKNDNTALQGAEVVINDSFNVNVFTGNTDATGSISPQTVAEYIQNGSVPFAAGDTCVGINNINITCFTPYNITINLTGYERNFTSAEVNRSRLVNVSLGLDTTAPVVNTSLNKSLTGILQSDIINLSANATDRIGLSVGQVIVNDTGFVRYFNFSLSGTSAQFSQNITISCAAGCVINFTARVNDTNGNVRTNDTIITVATTPDTTFPVVNTSINNTNPLVNDVINFTGNITDDVGLLSANWTYNVSGVLTKLNYSFAGGTAIATVSNTTTLSCVETCVVNFTLYATDTNNNVRQNSTLVTVADRTAPVVNTSINNTSPLVNDVINFTGNITDLGVGLVSANWTYNLSGVLTKLNYTISGTSFNGLSNTTTLTCTETCVINFTLYATDANNNVKQNSTLVIVADRTAPVVNTSFNVTNANALVDSVINFTGNITDGIGLLSANWTYNLSGSLTKLNYTLSGTSATVSNSTTLTCTETCVINFTLYATDTNNNVGQNSTLIVVADRAKPRLNASLDDSNPGKNQRVNMTVNVSDLGGLSFCQFIINQTGANEFFNVTVNGDNDQCSQNYTIALAAGGVINFTVIVNDTSTSVVGGNKNQSEYSGVIGQIITVGNEFGVFNCTNLTSANTTYALRKDASSAGTCFNVLANNITLDCKGFEINYSQSVVGYGVNISSYNYSTIRSCNIEQADLATDTSGSHGVYIFMNSSFNIIFNNSVTVYGSGDGAGADASFGVYFLESVFNNSIYNNIITTLGAWDGISNGPYGVALTSYNNLVYSNTITTSGGTGYGVYLSTVYNNSVYSNNITTSGSLGYGVYLNGATYNNNIYSNNITTRGGSGYGVYLSTVYNNSVYSNVITTGGGSGFGVYLTGATYNNSVYSNNITTRGSSGYGVYVQTNPYSNNVYSNNITTSGSLGYGVYLTTTVSSNNVYSNIITTSNTSSSGIYLNSNVFNNTIYDNNITTKNMTGSYGVYLLDKVSNNTFYRNTISSLATAVMINGTITALTTKVSPSVYGITFTNDTILPCPLGCAGDYQDIVLTANATDITFTNVSFNKSRVAFVPRSISVPVEKNNLTIKWFLDVRAARNTDNTALQGAEVVVNNSFAVNLFTGNTDANGRIATVTVTEFTMNGSVPFNVNTDTCVGINNVNITCFTPMNISVNLSGYNSNFTSVDVNRSKLVNVSLSLAVDTTAPKIVTGFNASSPSVNDILNFTGNITDTGGLSSANWTYNVSGVVTYLNYTLGGNSATVSNSTTLTCTETCVINFTLYATDANNNVGQNSTLVTVADRTAPVVNTSINNTSPLVNDVINFTGNVTDGIGLLSANWTYNLSGSLTKLNYTFTAGTTIATMSNTTTLNCVETCVINFTLYATDINNNVRQNSTLVTVIDRTAPVVNTSINNTSPLVNDVINFTGNVTDLGGLLSANWTYNLSGVLTKLNYTISGTSFNGLSNTTTLSCVETCVVNFTLYATDVNNNVKQNSTLITVADRTAPIVNTSVNNTSPLVNDVINFTGNVTDLGVGLLSANWTYNLSGVLTKLNYSFAAGTLIATVSNSTTLTCTETCVVNFTLYATDVNNNVRQNSTLVTVIDRTAPVVNTSINNTSPLVNDVINFTGNVSDDTGLLSANWTYNLSGVLTKLNYTFAAGTLIATVSNTTTLTCTETCVVNFTLYATDVNNNVRQNSTLIVVTDITQPRINASLDDSTPGQNQRVNMTANVSDLGSGLSFCQFIENGSLNGNNTYFNVSVAGTNGQCSQNYTIALGTGNVINFTVIVNDTSTAVVGGNKNQTSQIITVGSEYRISNCTNLDIANTNYALTKDANSGGTCMYVLANNVTLDCKGFEINYSQSVVGYGVNNSGYNYSTIRSCNIVQNVTSRGGATNSYGIYIFKNAIFNTIYNNSITTNSTNGYGVYLLTSANNNNITNNTIITNGNTGIGAYLSSSSNNSVYSNTITTSGSDGYGARLSSSSNNNNVYSNTITTSGSFGYGAYLLSSSNNNNVYSNTITTSGSNGYGALLSSSSNNSVYSNTITISGSSGLGAWLSSSSNNSVYSNTITTSGSNGYGALLSSSSNNNNVYSNTITTNKTNSYGIYLNNDIYNSTIYDNNITTKNMTSSYGIYLLKNVNNNTFYRNRISSLAIGILVNGSGQTAIQETRFNTFTNDTIITCTTGCAGNYQDIVLTANATDITFTNVSFNKSRVEFVPRSLSVPVEKNNMTVRWFLNVNVTNSTNNAAMIGAEVVVNNSLGANVFTGSTDANGGIATVTVTEFTLNGSVPFNVNTDTCVGISNVNITCFTPMNITVNITGYDRNFTSVDVNKSRLVNVSLGLLPDATAPVINATFNKSVQLIEFNNIINLTGNATDAVGLSFGQIIVNDTGFVRYFNFSLSGTSAEFSQNITVSCSPCVINFTAIVNDTSNNVRMNDTIVTVTPEREINSCGNLDIANANYTMINNASSAGTCFNVLANNITLDCKGFDVNYSQSVVGYGVNISGYNYTTIRSCNIVQNVTNSPGGTANSYGVYVFNNASNNAVYNNSVTTFNSYAVYLFQQAYNNSIYENTITTSTLSSTRVMVLDTSASYNTIYSNTITARDDAIFLSNSNNNSIYSNVLSAGGNSVRGVLLSTSSSNSVYKNNMTITGGSGSIGVLLSQDNYNNNIYENIITNSVAQGGYGIRLSSSVYNNSVYNNIIYNSGSGGIGIYMTSTVYNNTIYGNTINTTGSSGYGIGLSSTAYNNSVYSNNITTSNTDNYGVYLNDKIFNNLFYNNNITTKNITGSYGIYLSDNAVNNTFFSNTISSLAIAVMLNGSDTGVSLPDGISRVYGNTFTNDTIVPCAAGCAGNYQDIVLTSNATDITFTNVSFNKSRVAFVPAVPSAPVEKNNLTVRWFLAINVTNSTDNNPFSGAEVVVNNSLGANVFTGNTDANGGIATVTVTEFTLNGSVPFNAGTDTCVGISNVNITCFTPMNITVNITGYDRNFTSVDVNRSRLVNVSLGLSPDRTAPVVNASINNTSPLVNDVINFTGNITDDVGLLSANWTYNVSGVLTKLNYSFAGGTAIATVSNTTTLSCVETCVVNFTLYATDTNNNVRQNSTLIIVADRTLPVVNTSINNTNPLVNDVINFTGNITDLGVGLVSANWTYNLSGSLTKLNYTISGTSFNGLSNTTTLTCTETCVINFTLYATDANNNVKQNSTLVIVADRTAPVVNTSFNVTAAALNDAINFTGNITDAVGLLSANWTYNVSGVLTKLNYSFATGTLIATVSNTTTLTANGVFNFTLYATDVNNNVRQNSTLIIVADRTLPVVNTSINNTNPLVNDVINFTGNVSDDIGLLSANWTYNLSGVLTKLNYTISGTSFNGLSNTTTLSCVETCVVNFTLYATDTNNNVRQNSTLVTVADRTAPVVNTSINNTSPLVNDVINFTGNVTDLGGLLSANWTYNLSGVVTYLNYTLSGTSATVSNSTTLTCTETCVINFTLYSTDVNNNVKQNSTLVTVADRTAPVLNTSFNKSLTNIQQNDVINLTANATDAVGFDVGQVIVNDTGFVRYFNFSLSGTSAQFSQNITVSCAAGCVINFTARANDTNGNYRTNDNIVTVTANQAPVIKLNNASFAADPVAGGSSIILISFNVTDAQGIGDINATKAVVNLTLGGSDGQFRFNSSEQGGEFGTCGNHTEPGSEPARVIINCTVVMRYYDNASSNWVVNVSVPDLSGAIGRNDTITFTYNSLAAFSVAARGVSEGANLNFTELDLNDQNKEAKAPILLNNTGNTDFDQINITAATLTGVTITSEIINASSFFVNITNATAGAGVPLNNSAKTIGDATLPHGFGASGDTAPYSGPTSTIGNQSLYFWVDVPASGLSSQTYSNTWNITIADLP